ncbi:rRNA metabolism protein, SBDS family [Caldisphaera lagunensis DSM 15908]|uniref:rRNA metabolism protein, SBDS family n=1 Tax=Caldisphaera lagunensis (strain DSM 15908 / JCM 11604 / ANMR 0165 / IC-154) TaxID=1056495 RepID=L0A8K8_CALLD|nr:ribosome assembly factor SBDS [Caldisphaera lagunensis]AFZ70203.1 rRNA metabolism protein, SBDS family [Caldisphaera lagunensis DSM 15908]
MTKKQEFIIAWIELKGQKFEIPVKPDLAFKFREGEKVSISEVLWADTIFKDVKKGLKASPDSLRKAFGTEDIEKIAEKILKEGQIQLTEEERKKMIEAKRKQIINYIVKNTIDPKSGKPIPEQRIENALDQVRFNIDPFKGAEAQALEAVKKLSILMPIKVAKALLEITIPSEYASRAYKEIQRIGEVKKANWGSDGSLKVELEIPAGAQIEVIDKVQSLAKGQANISVKVV